MSSGPQDDYYELLGVPAYASDDELRRAWRQLAMRWHPDRAGTDTTFIFQKLLAAYNVLADAAQRAAYDRTRSPVPVAPVRRRAPGTMIRNLSAPLNALIARGVARRADGEVIELDIDDETAAEGGMITISMRVMVRCLACAGGEAAACHHCDSKREIDDLFAAWLAVPPGVGTGELLRPSALLPGMKPVAFRVRRVAG
ncbi:MAG: DnaJ domain-containing protein [Deltaproteobacteria bacterium]|nr:DnaJ domain-containing protein [Deltaproteobacteria bacterium]